MRELSIELFLPAPPKRVFEFLARFETYETWNPYLRIEGEAALKARVRVYPMTYRSGLPIGAPAVVSAFDPEKTLELSSGMPFLSSSIRFFELTPHEGGTLLRHGVRFTGVWISWRFARGKQLARLRAYYEKFGKALADGVAGRRLKNISGNRHARRAQQASQKTK